MVNLELTPTEYLRRNFTMTTSGMFDADVFAYVQGKVGAGRLMFAVDYPYEDSLVAGKFFAELDLSDVEHSSSRS